MLNLDTHILVDALRGELRPKERHLLQDESWGISAIVLWEIAMLVQRRKVEMDLDDPQVKQALRHLHVWPIDLAIVRQSTQLDFRSDPADELIAATSVVHNVPLLTRDRTLRGSKLVPFPKGFSSRTPYQG